MGMYNPTNTRCQMISYLDTDAPQYLFGSRVSFYQFLDKVLTEGFNTQSILAAQLTTHEDELVIELTYETEHGYSLGQLLDLSGSTQSEYTGIFRVVNVEDPFKVLLGNLDEAVEYPPITSLPLLSKVAPLDWEIVYSSDNQRSYRSKMPNSSKNILTLKTPTHPLGKRSNSTVVHEVDVSKSMDASTGEAIDSYLTLKEFPATTASGGKPYGYLYHYQYTTDFNLASSVNPGNTARAPWYIVGDGRIFTLICSIGHHNNVVENSVYVNYDRQLGRDTYRYSFVFGDPNAFDENDIYEGSGTIVSAAPVNASLGALSWGDGPRFGSSVNAYVAFTRTYDGQYTMQRADPVSFYGSNITNFSGGHGTQSYPNVSTGGFLFFPISLVTVEYGYNHTRAFLPYATYSPLSLNSVYGSTNRFKIDWNPIRSVDKSFHTIIIHVVDYYSNLNGSYSFNVGK